MIVWEPLPLLKGLSSDSLKGLPDTLYIIYLLSLFCDFVKIFVALF